MEHKPALYALIKLHAEIGGKLQANQAQREKLIEDMKHVEAVLHLLEPGFNARAISIKRRNNPNPLFKRGHVIRGALDVLRTATAPMSAEEIALALFRSKGVEQPDRDDLHRLYGAVSASLLNNKDVTLHDGRPRRWTLGK
ncbi:hypothetical protein [Mesorhizobium sp.]|uniref:hypothetical protein n=1 Tax=Mesorhizobium sp. TaxID=1871066 RepID=UPI00120625FF|nr:hypothetical protein [Mesorhizobium sp.]TIP18411.1 MAG: hypothetical protein E5X66_15610 [Mesorhizobium sp.]